MADDILIVDDEKDIRSLLSMTLEDEGYATLQAANADEAQEQHCWRSRQNWPFLIYGCAIPIWTASNCLNG